MDLSEYAESNTYFDLSRHIICSDFANSSIRGRLFALKVFFEMLLALPFALVFKIYKTFFRGVGLLLSSTLLLATLGTSTTLRECFMRRVSSLANDLADWVLLPLAVLSSFSRLLLASLIHPALFLRF